MTRPFSRPDGNGGFITILGPVTGPMSTHAEQYRTGGVSNPSPQPFEPIGLETSLHQSDTGTMIINGANLRSLNVGFSTAFQSGFSGGTPLYQNVAMIVPSATRSNEYGWLGAFPRVREWIGDRVVQNLETQGYTIKNRSFESTISVPRDDIQDDNIGIFSPMVSELGRQAATFPDELVWDLLTRGWETPCFDGQFFFDMDHPVLDATGKVHSIANTDGGTGVPWFLMDNTRVIRPIIYQERQPFKLVRMDSDTDEAVFNRKEFRYGTDGRCNVGYGFWQLAWGSKQPLDAAHYETARAALTRMKGDYGRPLGVRGSILVVGPSYEAAARRLLLNETVGVVQQNAGANGQAVSYMETNPWKGTAELLVVPWLE